MSVYAIGVFATFVLYIFVGNYAGRKVKGMEDYYVVGRNAPTIMIVGTLVASYTSTVAFMGETGFSYDGYPVLLLILMCLNVTGYIVGALYFGRYLRRSEYYTIPEFFGNRFNSRSVRSATGWITIIGIGAYLVAVTQGASLLMSELLGLSYGWSLLLVWAVYTSFTFYSGSQGVVLTDTIMFFLFSIIAFLAGPYIMSTLGGWDEAVRQLTNFELKPDIMAWHGMTGENAFWPSQFAAFTWAIILGFVWSAVVAISPWQASRYLMAKNEHVTLRSGLIAPACILLMYVVLQFSAAAINLTNPDIAPSEKAYVWAAFNILPTWMGVVLLGGIMAAALSSCSTFLSLVGFSVSRDIMHASGDSQKVLRFSRIVMACVGLVTLLITYYQPPAVMWIGYFAATLFAASWGPVAFASIWSKRITAAGAFWGIVGGFVAVTLAETLKKYGGIDFPVYLRPPIIGAGVSILCMMLGSMMTQVSDIERQFREKLHISPQSERDAGEVGTTMAIAKIILGLGFVTMIAMYFLYAVPYNAALQ